MLSDPLTDLLDLLDEHRGEVHDRARGGISLQVRGHVGVVLDRMKVRPGKDVLPGQRVAILWLVHVPQQNDRQARTARRSHARRRNMSEVTSTTPLSVT